MQSEDYIPKEELGLILRAVFKANKGIKVGFGHIKSLRKKFKGTTAFISAIEYAVSKNPANLVAYLHGLGNNLEFVENNLKKTNEVVANQP